ncbi:60s ribosomal protein l7a [Anaeramoeba flamelloides]|uniref:60s ribosomal protein l7a n=1 Tax=Anaeramoeba flamelloides TaxID=1746091 RepID=A0AAV7YFC2_9EUKA|nr:60s ribosomal protein l7a [Anaeramoeba flamelloides]
MTENGSSTEEFLSEEEEYEELNTIGSEKSKLFNRIDVVITGIEPAVELLVTNQLKQMGAKINAEWDALSSTHLICGDNNQVYEHVSQLGGTIVTPEWAIESFEAGMKLNEELYLYTPTKDKSNQNNIQKNNNDLNLNTNNENNFENQISIENSDEESLPESDEDLVESLNLLPDIFSFNVVYFYKSLSIPRLDEIKRGFVAFGGTYLDSFDSSKINTIITTSKWDKTIQKFYNQTKGNIRVLDPNWIVKSMLARKRQPNKPYFSSKSKQVRQKKNQPKKQKGKGRKGKKKQKKVDKFAKVYSKQKKSAPVRDLYQVMRWPKYIKIQRQRKVLMKRLRVPPAINQFTNTLERNTAYQLFTLLSKYSPETKKQKKTRLQKVAESKVIGDNVKSKKPLTVKYGINHVTSLVERKKAKLVIIAHDVDPIELVVWLPALCRKMGVPYCIVKGKARLGKVVHKKTATALVLTDVKQQDKNAFAKIIDICMPKFNDNVETRTKWGGGVLSSKARKAIEKNLESSQLSKKLMQEQKIRERIIKEKLEQQRLEEEAQKKKEEEAKNGKPEADKTEEKKDTKKSGKK